MGLMISFFLIRDLSPHHSVFQSEQHGVKMEEPSLKDPLSKNHSTRVCVRWTAVFPSRLLNLCLCCLTAHNSGLEPRDFCRKVQAFSLTGSSSDKNSAVSLYKKCAAVFHCIFNLNLRWSISTNDTIKPQIHLHYCVEPHKSPVIIIIRRCYSDPYRRDGLWPGCWCLVIFC